jgi:hypothetical protein
MVSPVINIIMGLIFIAGGASGKMSLIGTNSSGALMVAGAVVMGWGIFSLWKQKSR